MAYRRRRRRSTTRSRSGYRSRARSYGRRRVSRRAAPRRRSTSRRRSNRAVRIVLQVAGMPSAGAAAAPLSIGMKTNRITRARY